ncbi:MAG: cbb3-type cytochrome c oxidase subunit I [Burkholderiales bacterium]
MRSPEPVRSPDPVDARAAHGYALEVPDDGRRRLAIGWLALGLAALVGSGLFAVLLVLSRAPYTKNLFVDADFFRVALVVHVDLSVLVWFAAIGGMLWSLNSTPRALAAGWAALGMALAGTLLMCVAPFAGGAMPVMSNYIPVVHGPWFLAGLTVFAAACTLLVLRSMWAVPRVGVRLDGVAALRFGLNSALVSAALALIAFGWSWLRLPPSLEGKPYFEVLFWGGGHVLQFTWTLLMLVAWVWLAEAIGARLPLSPRIATLFFGVGLASVFATPVIYLAWDIVSVQHYRYLTWIMRFGGGLAILPFALALGIGLATLRGMPEEGRPLRAALISSMALFGAGGLIGFAIEGNNVRIPAHYHGCIVGVTLAFMGLVYHLLPRLGFAKVPPRAAALQGWLYGSGQLLHIAGLAWSGGYGVQRKAAGAEQVLRTAPEIAAMGLMGLGGLVAIIGGLMFLVIAIDSMRRGWKSSISR